MNGTYPAVKTEGGYLVTVPEHSKVYLIEAMPYNPFGKKEITDVMARAETQASSVL